MRWQIILTDTAFSNLKRIEKSDKELFFRVKFAVNRLTSQPMKSGKPLLHEFGSYRTLKDSDFKIIFWVDNKKKSVVITAIYHEKASK